jgi:hypothetical protein
MEVPQSHLVDHAIGLALELRAHLADRGGGDLHPTDRAG